MNSDLWVSHFYKMIGIQWQTIYMVTDPFNLPVIKEVNAHVHLDPQNTPVNVMYDLSNLCIM